jgi:hypothetical protein
MQIEVLGVEVESKGKYKEANVSFKDRDGKVQGKKVVSFNYPEVFSVLSAAKAGETYDIKAVKEGNYWNWAEAKKTGMATGTTSQESSSLKVRSSYETPEERAARQVYIVRQSSIASAIEYFNLIGNKKATLVDVLSTARTFEDFVFDRKEASRGKNVDAIEAIKAMDDDIPL